MLTPSIRRRIRPGLVLVLVAVATVRAGSEDRGPETEVRTKSRVGVPEPIAVAGGRSRFQVVEDEPGAETLVVVSALSRAPGPFRVRLSARAVSRGGPSARIDEGPRRAPRLEVTPLPVPPELASRLPVRLRNFHLLVREGDVASASNYLAVRGVLRAVGRRVQVYVDAQDVGRVGDEVIRDVLTTFDDRVFPVASRTIGRARDVDGDGRFTILFSSWLSRLAGGRYAVDGFVRGADLDPSLVAPFSNHCDMMYLNAALAPGRHLRTILAHEYTHAVTYTEKSFGGPGGERNGDDEEGWLDEALAHLGEDLHAFSRSNLDYRISAFLSCPERYRLVVEDYFAADLFRSHGNRGGTYLFLRWCADCYGPGLLPALIRSTRRGTENLESATGASFASLYREWSTALYLSGLVAGDDPRAGFRSIDVRGLLDGWELAGPRAVSVSPGEGTESWSAAGTSSHYVVVGSSRSGAVEVEVDGPPEADLQVTAVRLPRGLARLDLRVRATTTIEGEVRLQARVAERNGVGVRLIALAWEPLVPAADPHTAAFRRGGLDGAGIASAFGTSSLLPRGALHSRAIPMEGVAAGSGPVVVKAIGVDATGRRVAAWTEFDPVPEPDD